MVLNLYYLGECFPIKMIYVIRTSELSSVLIVYRLSDILFVTFLDYYIGLLWNWFKFHFERIVSCFVKYVLHLIKLISVKHHRWFRHLIRFCFKIFINLLVCFSSYWYFWTVGLKDWLNNWWWLFIRWSVIKLY